MINPRCRVRNVQTVCSRSKRKTESVFLCEGAEMGINGKMTGGDGCSGRITAGTVGIKGLCVVGRWVACKSNNSWTGIGCRHWGLAVQSGKRNQLLVYYSPAVNIRKDRRGENRNSVTGRGKE